jgi:hypothetical protein
MFKYYSTLLLISISSLMAYGQCSLRDMTVTPSDCTEGNTFEVEINFLFDEVSDSFSIRGNGQEYGFFAYTDLPVVIGPLEGNCNTPYEFVAKDKIMSECSTFLDLGKICCNAQECAVEIIDFKAARCSEEGMIIQFDLETAGTAGLGFDVYSGENFIGFYNYDQLPLTINNFKSSGTATEKLIVCENDNPDCCDTLVFETTCGCRVYRIDVDVVDCNDNEDTFYAKIDMEYQETSDSFLLGGNNTTYGSYAYVDLPIIVGPFPFSESIEYEFLVLDKASAVCFNFVDLGVVNGCSRIPCDIDDVVMDLKEEDCTPNGILYGTLTFKYEGSVADSFEVRGNGNFYGTYAYGKENYEIGPIPGNCESVLEFVVIDKGEEGCRDFTFIEDPVCCVQSCIISDVRVDLDDCMDDGNFFVNIFFNYSGEVADSFEIRGNGQNYGTYVYGKESYRLGPLKGDCETIYEFVVIDKNNPDCKSFVEMEEPVCCEVACPLREIGVDLNCNDGFLIIAVGTTKTITEDSANIYFNDVLFKKIGYNEFPYKVILNEEITFPLLIEVVDANNVQCVVEKEIENGCENCEIGSLNIDFLECDSDNKLFFKVNFETNRSTDKKFKLSVDEVSYGFYSYGELPITIGPVPNTGQEIFFVARDSLRESCVNRKSLDPVTCSSSIDELSDMGIRLHAGDGRIVIFNDELMQMEISIHSIIGQRLFQGSVGYHFELNTSSWMPGIVIARIKVDRKIHVLKLFIQ